MRVYEEGDRLKTETVSDLTSAYQLLIEHKSQSKEAVDVLFCGDCDKLVRMEDVDECPPLYECSNDNCGTTFVGIDGRNCPECNRPFSRKLADHACEDCETEMEETTVFECGNDDCSQHGLHLTEEEALKCKVEKTQTILDHAPDGKVTAAHVQSVVDEMEGVKEPERVIEDTIKKDSKNLSQLKELWGKCSESDCHRFRVWLRGQKK